MRGRLSAGNARGCAVPLKLLYIILKNNCFQRLHDELHPKNREVQISSHEPYAVLCFYLMQSFKRDLRYKIFRIIYRGVLLRMRKLSEVFKAGSGYQKGRPKALLSFHLNICP